jgi:hypothetical protein
MDYSKLETNIINTYLERAEKHHKLRESQKVPTGDSESAAPGVMTGQCFIGFSFSQNEIHKVPTSNAFSVVRQRQFDFNEIQDRQYQHTWKTNDDGWLCGGGEGLSSFKVPNVDSSHIELVHPGTFSHRSLKEIIQDMTSVRFDPTPLKPSTYRLNTDIPPEFEVQFSKEDNPSMWLLYLKLADIFSEVSACELNDPFNFHVSITRKIHFHSESSQQEFLDNATAVLEKWQKAYPNGVVLDPLSEQYAEVGVGGVYLFVNRNTPICYFPGDGQCYCCCVEEGEEKLIPVTTGSLEIDKVVFDRYLSDFQ